MNKLINSRLTQSLFLITLFSLIAYTPLIPFLGFYSDDFFFAYVAHFFGFEGIMQSLIVDRPFNGYLLAFNYFLLGDNVFLWHLYAYLFKLAGGLILFFTLLKLWPKKLQFITLITLLFLLYPGYLQQTLSLGFVNWMITLDIWILSLFFTVWSFKSAGKFKPAFFALLSIFCQVNSLLQLEFFIGLEVLRLLIINYLVNGEITFRRIIKTLVFFSPYFFSILGFLFWRILIFKPTREVTDIGWVIQSHYSNPLWILNLPMELLHSLGQTLVLAYFVPIVINFIRLPLLFLAISFSLGLFCAAILFSYFRSIKNINPQEKIFGKQLLLLGFISITASTILLILLGRFVRVYFVYDRYTLTSIIGVSLLITGLLLYKFSTFFLRWILIILISLSVTSHLMNGFWHKVMWDRQKDFWWQLHWRAPVISDNAMLILDFPPVTKDILFKDIVNKVKWYRFYWVEEQIWSAGNLFLNYSNPPKKHFYGDFLADSGILEKMIKGEVETINNRNLIYTRDFTKSIIINVPSDVSCLRVLAGENLIKQGPTVSPPTQIFGSEPIHNWCYFFQKASLAKQMKDWNQLLNIKQEVIKKNLKPQDPNEWLVFDMKLR